MAKRFVTGLSKEIPSLMDDNMEMGQACRGASGAQLHQEGAEPPGVGVAGQSHTPKPTVMLSGSMVKGEGLGPESMGRVSSRPTLPS